MIEVDLVAPILFAREALPALRESGEAAIVNVSSAIALVGLPFYATYAAVKARLARFGEALRSELINEGVHVLTVYPGATDTPMMATNRAGPDLGFAPEAPEAVADALVGDREVIRGGAMRFAMISANREWPAKVDVLKLYDLAAADQGHGSAPRCTQRCWQVFPVQGLLMQILRTRRCLKG